MVVARLFAWLDRVLGGGARDPGVSAVPRSPGEPLPGAALLSVDGGGQVLLCGAERLTLGHLRAGRADLGFLADVGALHAALQRTDSLHAGPGWDVVPLGGETVTLDGRALGPEGARLGDGARLRLGTNVELVVRVPDAASASVVLELLHGVECAGARQLVLFAPGPGGRVRIGAARAHHVRVPNLEFELALQRADGELELSGDMPFTDAGDTTRRAPARVPFPPPARVALTCGGARGARPPFALSLEPVLRSPR